MNAPMMYGAKAYAQVGLETGVNSASQHELIIMLYDGAIKAINNAKICLEVQNIQGKVESMQKAIRIIDEGLASSLDVRAGGEFAERLLALYDYMVHSLVQANAKNDALKMDEIVTLLADLRSAWQQIGQTQSAGPSSTTLRDSLRA